MAEKDTRAPRASKRTGSSRRPGEGGPALPDTAISSTTGTGTTRTPGAAPGLPPSGGADGGAEPIVFAERITVIAEVPIAGDDAGVAALSGGSGAPGPAGPGLAAEQRYLMIAERAYERARQRGFAPGGELEDWLLAEQEVDAQLGGG